MVFFRKWHTLTKCAVGTSDSGADERGVCRAWAVGESCIWEWLSEELPGAKQRRPHRMGLKMLGHKPWILGKGKERAEGLDK